MKTPRKPTTTKPQGPKWVCCECGPCCTCAKKYGVGRPTRGGAK